MRGKVLHILSQRPGRTGSGTTLDALVREAASRGWEQSVIAGIPDGEGELSVGGLGADHLHPLRFEQGALDFPVPGMSDVMPYRSSRWSTMTDDQLGRYRAEWRRHIREVIGSVKPDLIHSHHIWLMSSLLPDLAGGRPIVLQCHATGLRQMELCPHLANEVRTGCARADRFLVLHDEHADLLATALGVGRGRIHQTGAGFREDLFHTRGRRKKRGRALLYVGKYSASKGLPQLLDVVVRIDGTELHVAGSGAGAEADAIRGRMEKMEAVTLHGQLDQEELGRLMRRCDLCVLPSYYEGVPLVLVEAAACGCAVVATALPGVKKVLAPALGGILSMVEPPPMTGVDTPSPGSLPAFVDRLAKAVTGALERRPAPADMSAFRWDSIFRKTESIWEAALNLSSP